MKTSLSGRKDWDLQPESSLVPHLVREAGVTPLQARLLANRGLTDTTAIQSFLSPRLSQMIDPMRMKGMDEAVKSIVLAMEEHEKITVYGDYDADGLTATALLATFLSHLGLSVETYVPDRLKEGYGLNEAAIKLIRENGTGLIITVDCGISNDREVSLAKRLGMDVVITDHHLVPSGFQPQCPVINPHQPGCSFPFKGLSGVGLAFFLAVGLRAALREKGWFKSRSEPDLRDYLDLVALGTMADRVPLLGQNRILVSGGVSRMADSIWPGIRAIMNVAGVGISDVSSEDLAFRVAPRLNAPGRMGDSLMGLQILMTEKQTEAHVLASKIDATNVRRRAVEQEILEKATAMIDDQMESRRTLLLASENWHTGVLGIVASRLVDRYHKPVMIAAIKDGIAVGSGRSIDGFDLHSAMKKVSHCFLRFGGHSHAAGFTLEVSQLEALRKGLEEEAQEHLRPKDMIPTIRVDSELSFKNITLDVIHQINALAPFGEGNPEPVFMARSVKVFESRIVGERHLKLRLGQGGQALDAIAFGLGNRHPLKGISTDFLFTPEINRWKGTENVQLKIIDLGR
jgi:single-stranded-DNA-specific exonuclease